MFSSTMPLLSRSSAALIGLVLLCSLTSGCATRMLMSSDRYEKPDNKTMEFRSSDEISRSWYPDQNLEQAYLAALRT